MKTPPLPHVLLHESRKVMEKHCFCGLTRCPSVVDVARLNLEARSRPLVLKFRHLKIVPWPPPSLPSSLIQGSSQSLNWLRCSAAVHADTSALQHFRCKDRPRRKDSTCKLYVNILSSGRGSQVQGALSPTEVPARYLHKNAFQFNFIVISCCRWWQNELRFYTLCCGYHYRWRGKPLYWIALIKQRKDTMQQYCRYVYWYF